VEQIQSKLLGGIPKIRKVANVAKIVFILWKYMIHIKTILHELPHPPQGKTGWPWDCEVNPNHNHDFRNEVCIPISIVTPNFNGAEHLEEAIRSVILQNYPRLEYYVIDGGSADNSVDIIRRYSPWLSGWLSETDEGQSDAINKGYSRVSGEVFNWLCSDDLLSKGALWQISRFLLRNPQVDVLAGRCLLRYESNKLMKSVARTAVEDISSYSYLASVWQPSCYFRKKCVLRSELVNNKLHYCMDRELWSYLNSVRARWEEIPVVLSTYRFTGKNKSVTGGSEIIRELVDISGIYHRNPPGLASLLKVFWIPIVVRINHCMGNRQKMTLRFISKVLTIILLIIYPKTHVKMLQKQFYSYSRW
jgi:glycosyltransferase involved in cell wall biosynthesis